MLTAPQVWLAIVNKIQMESMICIQEFTKHFENMTVAQLKSENISIYITIATNLLL